jgi:N-methylhydantoinase A/oxoprolinase/acetone carboxylase beta subunit
LVVWRAGARAAGRGAAAPAARRRVWLGDWVEVPLHRMDALATGQEIKGPAVFESATTTVLVRESEHVTVTPHGWLDIRLG